jgi:hypothetical protein
MCNLVEHICISIRKHHLAAAQCASSQQFYDIVFCSPVARVSRRNTLINCQNHQKTSLLVEEQSVKLILLKTLVGNSVPLLELKMMSQRMVETVNMS